MQENLKPYLEVSGQLCRHLGVLTEHQVENILWSQAAAMELQKVNPQLDFKPMSAVDILAVVNQYHIPHENIVATRQTLKLDSFVPQGVPRFMEMAAKVGLRKIESDPVLGSQAAVRIFEEVEKLQGTEIAPSPEDWRKDFTKATQERPWISSKDPAYLEAGQAVNQLAEMLRVAVAKNPAIKHMPAIREAGVALTLLSAKAMKASAQQAERANMPEVAQKMDAAVDQLLAGVGHSLRHANHAQLVEQINRGLEAVCNGLEYEDGYKIGERAAQRLEQAKGLSGVVLERHQQLSPGYTSTATQNGPLQYHYTPGNGGGIGR